jgi:hypothetical protein
VEATTLPRREASAEQHLVHAEPTIVGTDDLLPAVE